MIQIRKRTFVLIFIGTILLAAGDIATTHIGLQMGLSEGNPIMRYMYSSYGVLGLVGFKTIAMGVMLALAAITENKELTFLMWAVAFGSIHILVIINNLILIS